MKNREQLINRMIRIYGYEHKIVLQFAALCERAADNEINDKMLWLLVAAHEETPVFEE